MDFERTYSLTDIARKLDRPRTTLISWLELFREFIPVIGSGRTQRYKEEALEIFALISQMKDRNEPNDHIRNILRSTVKEITIIEEEDEPKPFLTHIVDSYDEVLKELENIKDIVSNQSMAIQMLAEKLVVVTKEAAAAKEELKKENVREREALLTQVKELQEALERRSAEQYQHLNRNIKRLSDSNKVDDFQQVMREIQAERYLRREALQEWKDLGFFGRLGKDKDLFIEEHIQRRKKQYLEDLDLDF